VFQTVADYRRQAERAEASLLPLMAALAARVDPPFTAATRRRIRAALARSDAPRAALRRIWTAQMMTAEARALPFGHPDRRYFTGLDDRLRLCTATVDLLLRVIAARPLPLMPADPDPRSPEDGVLLAYQRCFDRLHLGFSPTPPDLYAPEIGRHGDLPFPFTGFLRLMQMVRRITLAQGKPRPVRFLDVGCGAGLKLVQAAEFFEVVQGLEFDPARAEVAQMFVARSRRLHDSALCGDALEFEDYGAFDVIYAYKPLSDPTLLHQMEARIAAQARPGTILVLPYFEAGFRFQDLGCGRLHDQVYLTGAAGQDLSPLLERAGHVGTVLPDAAPPAPGAEGFTAPLRAALRHWGHLG